MYEDANPFHFGDLALDEAFTDRENEVEELAADLRNGQNVLVYGPRRYGKTSLVLRASELALADGVLVAYCDLMKTPTKERFAAALAKTIYDDISAPSSQMLERAASVFRGLRVRPTMEIDPETGSLSFSFDASRRKRDGDIDDTIEKLLELPQRIASERDRRAVLILDEFQEVVKLDKSFPNLMRAIFQTQPEVGHVYLGSKRHVLDEIFNDKNEPFWRSAKRIEIGLIPAAKFEPFIKQQFARTDKGISDSALDLLLSASAGHPYGTQQLAYYVWSLVPVGHRAHDDDVTAALTSVLRGERNYFSTLWDKATEHQRLLMLALAAEPSGLYSSGYHERYGLESASHVQRALTTLVKEEIVGRNEDGDYAIIEPFLAVWLLREQADSAVVRELRAARETETS